MTAALRRQIKELAEAVPTHSQAGRDQLWRNVATELSHRQAAGTARHPARISAFSLLGVFACAILFVAVLPLFNQSHTPLGAYLLRSQMLEAAGRSDKGLVFKWSGDTAYAGTGYRLVASNPGYELWLHEDGLRFMLRHIASGQTWSTTPDVRDVRVSSEQFGRLVSPFSIRYGDEAGRVDGWANPMDDASLIEYYPISSGIGIRFLFEALGIAVRLDYELGDGYLQVSLPENGIETYGSYNVKSIELFPFFHVSGVDEENRLVLAASSSSDFDATLDGLLPQRPTKSQLMFGVTGERFGYMAEVVEGGEYATIHVDNSGLMVASQRVYVEFLVSPSLVKVQRSNRSTVRYHALVMEDAGGDRVADLLQQHLRENRAEGRLVGLRSFAG